MYKITETYTDYNGVERTEDFYFNFSKAELMEWDLKQPGGLKALLERVIAAKDQARIIELWKEIILAAYGEKSEDGKHFIKKRNGVKLCEAFEQTEVYSNLFYRFATDDKAAADFVNGIIPKVQDAPKQIAPNA